MRTLWNRLTALFSQRRRDRDLSEEVEVHLEMRAAELRQQGLDPNAARAAARRDFGGIEQMKETYRDRRGVPWVEILAKDVTYGLRGLRRNPAFTLAAVLSSRRRQPYPAGSPNSRRELRFLAQPAGTRPRGPRARAEGG